MAQTPRITDPFADNPAAARRYAAMVEKAGGVPDAVEPIDDLVLEALYGEDEEDDPYAPDFARRRPRGEDSVTGPTPGPSPEGEGGFSYGVPTQDWLSRGLKHPAGRGWEAASTALSHPSGEDYARMARDEGGAWENDCAGDWESDGEGAWEGEPTRGALPARDPRHPHDTGHPLAGARPAAAHAPAHGARRAAAFAHAGVAVRPRPTGFPGGWQPGDPPMQYDLDDPDPYAPSLPPGTDPWSAPFLPQGPTNEVAPVPPEGGEDVAGCGSGRSGAADGAPGRHWTTLCGHPAARFDAPARARFLDRLATTGNVRASAARAGVSRETVYRARRRHPGFARLWDAALIEARAHAAGELASYALDGVPQPVIVKGEHVATWRRIDARLLLAHMARLDRFAEANPAAARAAERFDALLAAHLGHEPTPLLRRAAEARSGGARRELADLPASREEAVRYAAGRALDDPDGSEHAVELACADAETEWEALAEEGEALVDAALNGAGAAIEFKSLERGLRGRNGVASVNTCAAIRTPAGRAPPSRCRAGSGRAWSRRRG